MPLDSAASWIDALPSVGAPAPPPAATAGPSWVDTLPSVTAHPAAQPDQPPPAAPPGHPVAGPTDPTSFWPSLTDIGRNVGTGIVNAMQGVTSMLPIAGGDQRAAAGLKPLPTPDQQRDKAFNTLGATEYQPQTWLGRRGQDLASAIPAAAALGPAALPAVAGGALAGGAVNEAIPGHPLITAAASMLGAKGAASVANAGTSLAGVRGAAGGSLPPEDAALAARAQSLGIPLNVAQVSTSPAAKYTYSATSKLPFSGAGAFQEAQQGAFNRAVASTFGEDAPRITPDVLNAARTRIGDTFNGVAARTSIPMGNDFLTDLQGVVNNARLTMSADSVAPVERQAMNIIDTAANNSGNIGGRAYIDLTAKGGPLDAMIQSSDSGLRNAGISLRNVIDDHLQANAAPDDLAALQQARAQWKAMKTVEPLTLRADTLGGATPSTGDISPAALRGAVNKSYSNAALAPLGRLPLNDLAKIGQRFLKEPPSSGTAERNMVSHATEGLGALGMAVAGHEAGAPLWASLGAPVATALAGRAINSVLRNQYLARQSVAASLNPNGFRFSGPRAIPAVLPPMLPPASNAVLPFGWAASQNTSTPRTP